MADLRTKSCPRCPVCGHEGTVEYFGLTDNLFFTTDQEWSMKACNNKLCGVYWLDPCPYEEDLALAYSNYYTHESSSGSSLKNILKNAYERLLSIVLAPWTDAETESSSSYMYLGERLNSPGCLLDIGCGSGDFLEKVNDLGWVSKGVDFDSAAVDHARNVKKLDVSLGGVESLGIEHRSRYDVITLSHVIEHVVSPEIFLRNCLELLAPAGILVLRTPNIESYGHLKFARNWRGLEAPRHVQIFSERALALVAKAAGFSSVQTFTCSHGAEYILGASYMLQKNGQFSGQYSTYKDRVLSLIYRPYAKIRASRNLKINPGSGEELYAFLRK